MSKRKPKVNNASDIGNRAMFAARSGLQFGGDRDLNAVLGYKVKLTGTDCLAMYQRGDIARPVVDAYPDACWRAAPIVYENEIETETPFEKSLAELVKRTKLWHYLARADRACGLGRYSLLVLGLDDSQATNQPAVSRSGQKLVWLLPVPEANAEISKWTTDATSANYGRPELYRVKVSNEGVMGLSTREYHYTRVIHIAENCIQDDIFGSTRIEAVYNRLFDMQKLTGGSAEMFWLQARNGLQFEAAEGAQISPADALTLKSEATEYQHQLRRILTAQNGKWSAIPGEVADPRGPAEVVLDMIAAAVRIPKRILLGNEAGELASSQDETAWISRVEERRHTFVEPMVLMATIERLISLGVLVAPTTDLTVEWPAAAVGAKPRAEIGLIKAQTLQAYAGNSAAQIIMPPEEFREMILELEPEPAGGFDDADEEPESIAQGPDADVNDPPRIRGRTRPPF